MRHIIPARPRDKRSPAMLTEDELARETAMLVWLEGIPLEQASALAGMGHDEFKQWLANRLSEPKRPGWLRRLRQPEHLE